MDSDQSWFGKKSKGDLHKWATDSLKSQTRREFLTNLIMIGGVFLGLGGLVGRFFQFLYPEIPPIKFIKVFAIKRSEIPQNSVRSVRLPQGGVMIVNHENQLRAFSSTCTHLGCLVAWHDDRERFICPCHNGVFDINGKVISGPPPRPLDEIKTILRGDDIFLLMKSREENP